MHNLELVLPARARQAQREADALLLSGKTDEAQAKIAEQREAERGTEVMKERQREIDLRLTAIADEKKILARRAFEDWYAKLQSLIRTIEHSLFVELLDSSLDEMRAYQERHGLTGTLADPYGFLVKDHHIQNLTADGMSAEWAAGQRWYRGRR